MLMAMTIPGLAIALIAFAFAEVAWRKVTGRSLVPWMRGSANTGPVAAIGFEQLEAVFGPGKQHEFERRHSALMHREDESDGAPPLFSVDIEAGRVRINRAGR